nr:hypothetical protein [Lachnospiraceae bacterium]
GSSCDATGRLQIVLDGTSLQIVFDCKLLSEKIKASDASEAFFYGDEEDEKFSCMFPRNWISQ